MFCHDPDVLDSNLGEVDFGVHNPSVKDGLKRLKIYNKKWKALSVYKYTSFLNLPTVRF